MEKVKTQQDAAATGASEYTTTIHSQRELEELLTQRDATIERLEQEIIRLRAELYGYHVQVIQHQHKQLQELRNIQ